MRKTLNELPNGGYTDMMNDNDWFILFLIFMAAYGVGVYVGMLIERSKHPALYKHPNIHTDRRKNNAD